MLSIGLLTYYLSRFIFVYGSESCKVTAGGTQFDLSTLAGHGDFDVSPPHDEVGRYIYTISFCANSLTCDDNSGNFIRAQKYIPHNKCVAVYGQWSTAKNEKTSKGFKTTFTGPTSCDDDPNEQYTGVFNYICDETATDLNDLNLTAAQTGGNDCKYTVTIPTDVACKGTAAPGGGLSGGSLFLIILVSVAFVYLLGMMSFGYYREKTVKAPHKGFWCNKLPYWTKTGCLVSWAASLSCYRWCCKKIFKAKAGDDVMEDALIRDNEESS